jgi:hypothetical protein
MLLLTENLRRKPEPVFKVVGLNWRLLPKKNHRSADLKRTGAVSAVIETAREIMQNAPHTSVRQLSQRNRLNLM